MSEAEGQRGGKEISGMVMYGLINELTKDEEEMGVE